jgi:hypothetical protein
LDFTMEILERMRKKHVENFKIYIIIIQVDTKYMKDTRNIA